MAKRTFGSRNEVPQNPWDDIDPEREKMARAIFSAARQIAEEDGDGEFDLSALPAAMQAIGGGFNRLVRLAAKGQLDEDDPKSMTDALRVASAALVDQRQPEQFQGLKWLTGTNEALVDPKSFQLAGGPNVPAGAMSEANSPWETTTKRAPPVFSTPLNPREYFDRLWHGRPPQAKAGEINPGWPSVRQPVLPNIPGRPSGDDWKTTIKRK